MTCPKATQNLNEVLSVGVPAEDTDDNFTTVTNHHSRKERKNHDKTKRDKQNAGKSALWTQNQKFEASQQQSHKSQETAPLTKDIKNEKNENQQEPVEKKVFIEAPIPKVNPWQTNKNAAQFISGQNNQSNNDRRILQPQQDSNSTGALI